MEWEAYSGVGDLTLTGEEVKLNPHSSNLRLFWNDHFPQVLQRGRHVPGIRKPGLVTLLVWLPVFA